jgi:hypothetical protein
MSGQGVRYVWQSSLESSKFGQTSLDFFGKVVQKLVFDDLHFTNSLHESLLIVRRSF